MNNFPNPLYYYLHWTWNCFLSNEVCACGNEKYLSMMYPIRICYQKKIPCLTSSSISVWLSILSVCLFITFCSWLTSWIVNYPVAIIISYNSTRKQRWRLKRRALKKKKEKKGILKVFYKMLGCEKHCWNVEIINNI